jgi:hypothetical protein
LSSSTRLLCLAALVAWCWASVPAVAHARVERYAVIIGNDRGGAEETPLRYAGSDAARVHEVLRDLGGFAPVDMVMLHNENADTVRSTLIAVNARIRAAMSAPDVQVLLLVYYSGHADSEDLHLGATHFPIHELTQLVSGSAASFRLVVLDACRSGALTRLKGGRVVAPFAIEQSETLPNNGLAFLTASSVNEDAQESDELRGSFFTHAFVSGLLGAADADGDGSVVLAEAYRYAYEATLRATSRTLAGTQHPTFRYDLRGQGELVLTEPAARASDRAHLHFPSGIGFLLFRDDANGAVVAEVSEHDARRVLSVRPGRYFVRGRGLDVLYEGAVLAGAGTSTSVDLVQLSRIEYARLVRKGGAETKLAHGPEVGLRARTTLANANTPCFGGFVGYGMDLRSWGAGARVSACSSGSDNRVLRTTTNAYDAEARVHHAWDISTAWLELAVGGGVSVFTQHYEPQGRALARTSLVPFVSLGVGAGLSLAHGFRLGLDLATETHFFSIQNSWDAPAHAQPSVGLRTSLMVGKEL